jgi:hypothetical protein
MAGRETFLLGLIDDGDGLLWLDAVDETPRDTRRGPMNKRMIALLTSVASLPLVAVTAIGTAAPASANPGANCGAYPPGQTYGIRVSPGFAKVHRGAIVRLSARVFRGGENCSGRSVGFYRRYAGQLSFHLDTGFKGVTDADGLTSVPATVTRDFRYFGNYNNTPSTVGARSGAGLIQVG